MSWLTAVGVMILISALMCGILSAITKILENSRLPLKVRACVNYGSKCYALYAYFQIKFYKSFLCVYLKKLLFVM